MPFVLDDFALKQNIPTLALKTTQDFAQFQLVESVKDAFILELRNFFAQTTAAARYVETLNIEKYAISSLGTNPFENLITLIREYPDILQRLPLISVTKATGNRKPLGLTGAFVDHVQYSPRVRSSNPEPYDLSAFLGNVPPATLTLTTRPDGRTDVASTLVFSSVFFPTPAAVTVQQIVNAIDVQALYARARAVTSGASVLLEILAGGPAGSSEPQGPNRIEITGGTAALLVALGYLVGQNDDTSNPLRPPCNRYGSGASFSIGLDVGATSDNERTEITDLLTYFLNVFMSDRDYTFYGQHVFEEATPGATAERFFQIILGDWSMAGEADIPRPDGEKEDKIYANRFNIPITIFDYVDRIIPPGLIPVNIQNSPYQFTFLPNDQPRVITGVRIVIPSDGTNAGNGTLTYTAGTLQQLQWQAPSALVPGAVVSVGAGGSFTLPGGDGTSIQVSVSATGLPPNSASQPVTITGVRVVAVSNTTAAGVGSLTFAIVGAARTLQWDPPGVEGPGPVVDVSLGGVATLFGAGGSSIQVRVTATALPAGPVVDPITITSVFTDTITITRHELPLAS